MLQNNPDRYEYKVLWEIENCTNNHLNEMEIFYIKKYDPQFNFTEGGDGSSGFKHSEETRKKMSEAQKGKNHPMYGKTLSEEHKKKISESLKGKTLSAKTRKKMSKTMSTTGFFRVSKDKDNTCKQGFLWRYRYQNKKIRRVNLLKLQEEVEVRGLPWEILDEEKAKKSLEENNKYHQNVKK